MEAGPVLDALAAKQVEDETPHAADAVMYLGRFGSAAMKPVVWEQLSRWHRKYVGTEQNSACDPTRQTRGLAALQHGFAPA